MARVTTEDCLAQVTNRYLLCQFATKRARQLMQGTEPTVESKNKPLVTALREVAAGTILIDGDVDAMQSQSLVSVKYPELFEAETVE